MWPNERYWLSLQNWPLSYPYTAAVFTSAFSSPVALANPWLSMKHPTKGHTYANTPFLFGSHVSLSFTPFLKTHLFHETFLL